MSLPNVLTESAAFLHGEVERNWACQAEPYYDERRANIEQMANPLQRYGELALLNAAQSFPETTGRLIKRGLPEDSGWRLAGAGSEHTAITDDQVVLKIHRTSVFMSESDRLALAAEFNERHAVMRNYLGNLVVDQLSESGFNPLNRDKRAVVTTQDYYRFQDLGLFPAYEPCVDRSALDVARHSYPGIEDALHDFAKAGLRMYGRTGLLPDTSGLNNVVVVEKELVSLDGQPHQPVKASEEIRLTGQLTDLLAALNER